MEKKTKAKEMFYERKKKKKGQNELKRKMDDLNMFLQDKKQTVLIKRQQKNSLVNKNFTTFKKDGICYIRSHVRNSNVIYNFCCQNGHVKKEWYVRRNIQC